MAGNIAQGANGRIFDVKNFNKSDWEYLDNSDCIVFGCPTYMGNVSSALKFFMEETGSRWFNQDWKDKIAGGFTSASHTSGDKLNVLTSITIFATQHSMIWVGSGDTPSDDEQEINRMGSHLGVMAAAKTQNGVKQIVEGDLLTCLNYGKRLLKVTKKLRGENV